jgi:hypothetical protein
VPVTDQRRADLDPLAHGPLDREAPAVELRSNALDPDAGQRFAESLDGHGRYLPRMDRLQRQTIT